MDATIFENFLYRLLVHVRERPEFAGRQVVLLMDNASIHHHRRVMDLALRMKAILLYNPQYSPWLNPVEKLFKYLKGHLRSKHSATRYVFELMLTADSVGRTSLPRWSNSSVAVTLSRCSHSGAHLSWSGSRLSRGPRTLDPMVTSERCLQAP